MKVLLSAFSCGPSGGSELGVGWNWVRQISRRHQVWLLTSDESEADIRRELPANVQAVFIPGFALWYRCLDAGLPGLDWIYYVWWQWKAYRAAKKLHAEVGFDLAHHVTFVSFRAPSFLALLPVPFIWGPVGGGGTPPRSLWSELGWRGRWSEGFRGFCQRLPRYDPVVRLMMRRTALILANIRETAELMPPSVRAKVRLMFGIGMAVSPAAAAPAEPPQNGEAFHVLFVAQLRPIKGGTLALRAFARLARARADARLVVLGDGVERGRLTGLARELGLADRVDFRGLVPRAQVLDWMKRADVLLFPSLRDSGGMVLLEAMAEAKPVICLDLGGPGHIVTPECGFKITPTTPEQVVGGLADALLELAADPQLRQKLGEAGRRRVCEHFDWDKRGEQMLAIYEEVVAGRTGARPEIDGGRHR